MSTLPTCLMPVPTMSVRVTLSPNHVAMPDVRCDLIWVGERLLLSGPQTRCRSTRFPGQRAALATLEPLVASAWLDIPLSEITDQLVPLTDVKPALAGQLSDAFFHDKIETVWGPIVTVAGCIPERRLELAVSQLRLGASVGSVAAALSLSPRHLGRLFQDQLGLLPRQFSRIVRLRRAIMMIKRGATMADAAHSAGFADQPHFNRDVIAFAGRSPTSLIPNVANVQDGDKGSPLD